MINLRKKYAKKVVNLKTLKEENERDDKMMGYTGGDYLEITDGKTNKFRLMPAHGGGKFFKMRKRYWLTIDNDGENFRRPVLDSRVHGNTDKDIIDEYVKFVKKHVKDKEKLTIITNWKEGLKAEYTWIAYAVKIDRDGREFGILSFKKTVRDAINKEVFIEDVDEPISVDPFTHPDNGLPLLIRYNSKPNKKKNEDYYSVSVGKKAIKITDEELEKFDESKTLDELFDNVYTLKDFEIALGGLEKFDIDKGIDIFEDDRWLEIVEQVKDQYEDEDEDEKPKKSKKKKVVEEEDDDEGEDDEEEDDEEEDEDDDEEDDDDEEEDDEEEDDDDEEEEDKKPKKKMSVEDIRKRLRKK